MSNEEILEGMSLRIREMTQPDFNIDASNAYFNGVSKYLNAQRIPIKVSEGMAAGITYSRQTLEFLGISE